MVVGGCLWTAVALVAAVVTRRPGPVLDAGDARQAWQELHGLERPVQETSRLVGAYVSCTQALARPLARSGLSPNLVTVAGIGPALVAAGFMGRGAGWGVAGGILVLVTGLLDGVDGAVAVLSRKTSELGFVLDSAIDRVVDLVLLAGPVLADRSTPTAAAAAGAGAALMWMEYVRARSQIRRPTVSRITPAERPTRVVLVGLGGIGAGTLDLAGGTALSWFWPVTLGGLALLCLAGGLMLLADSRRASSG